MSIKLKNIPKEELPRERLIKYGKERLTNEELLTIIFRTGTKEASCKDLAVTLLSKCSDIKDLRYISLNKLKEIKGIKEAKAIGLLASLELGKRVYDNYEVSTNIQIKNANDAFNYFGKYIFDSKQENLLVIYLDNQKKVIKHKIIFKGTINKSIVHPREVFKEALLESASAIIVMHNHPSGNLIPSGSDDETTSCLVGTGIIMGIDVLDHLIVHPSGYYSYLESGRIISEQNV